MLGPSDPADRRVSDRLLVRQAVSADPALLVVEIDPADLRASGGDEFAVVLTGGIDAARAAELVKAMRRAIAQPCSLTSVNATVTVGAAVGHAVSNEHGEAIKPAELLRRADKAMYRDKLRSKLKAA
ncbi:diguanylate cyclase [Novosphingobium sp.]|uniref:diguanylate cyclase n=1 Tax=Novosphingobium sp. TaxID=1874826 RepID=UPI002734E3D2|nr:diguanylate cyclase [Novosphingobium sp.]MDP3908173.1 diguanylate cyclase [Novosphingobium sp.]